MLKNQAVWFEDVTLFSIYHVTKKDITFSNMQGHTKLEVAVDVS